MSFFQGLNAKRLPGKIKGLLAKMRIDVLIPIYFFKFITYMAEMSKWIAENKSKCENDFYTSSFKYSKREELYSRVIEKENLDSEIDYLEFGVSRGASFKWWIENIKDTDARFYGFDTFTGLPEDWGPFKKGAMSNSNEIPKIDDSRGKFYQGLFQQTLLPFLTTYDPARRKVLHLDADIYSATLYVLTIITPYLRSGDILFFDEFNVPLHEYKAFVEWTSSFYIEYEVLGGVNNFYQTAIKIL